MGRIAPREYIEVEQEYSRSNIFVYTYKLARNSRRMHILEYIDISTGEIIPKRKLHIPEIRPEAMLTRFKRLDSLRQEVRDFAIFLLKFRNHACGFLVPMDTLVGWYADISSKRVWNIQRYFETLYTNKILSDYETPEKEFMIKNPTREKSDAKGDYDKAHTIYTLLRLKWVIYSLSKNKNLVIARVTERF